MSKEPLVKHIHQWNGDLVATLVATDQHKVGITVFNGKDAVTKKPKKISGYWRARRKAEKGELTNIPNREIAIIHSERNENGKCIGQSMQVHNLYDLLMYELDDMEDRSVRYFSKEKV